VTKSVYFSDPDGNELEVYSDNTPQEVSRFPRIRTPGMDKLDFAPDDPGLGDRVPASKG